MELDERFAGKEVLIRRLLTLPSLYSKKRLGFSILGSVSLSLKKEILFIPMSSKTPSNFPKQSEKFPIHHNFIRLKFESEVVEDSRRLFPNLFCIYSFSRVLCVSWKEFKAGQTESFSIVYIFGITQRQTFPGIIS